MEHESNAMYGAMIERGEILEVSGEGCSVKSYDRPGVVTPPLEDIHGSAHDVGERVCFFMFDDGSGKILTSL